MKKNRLYAMVVGNSGFLCFDASGSLVVSDVKSFVQEKIKEKNEKWQAIHLEKAEPWRLRTYIEEKK